MASNFGRLSDVYPSKKKPSVAPKAKDAAAKKDKFAERAKVAKEDRPVFCWTRFRKIMGGLKEIFFDYALWTSTHGIPHVARVHTNRARVFWTVTFVLCCLLMGFQVSRVVQRYLRYEKTTSFKLEVENQRFPAVTVCALNPFKKSAALQVDGIKDLLGAFLTSSGGSSFQKKSLQEKSVEAALALRTTGRRKREAGEAEGREKRETADATVGKGKERAPVQHRTYPCRCDSQGGDCAVVYGPNSARDRICVCTRAGEFCELCRGNLDDCIATWGTLETARPCICHSYNGECIEVTSNPTSVCLCNRVYGTCRELVNGGNELMRACRCQRESCQEVSKPDSAMHDICMCNTDVGVCRKCFDKECSEFRIVVLPCLCTSPRECSSIGQWEIVERHHLCYCRQYSRDQCTPCQSERCLRRFSVGWSGKPEDRTTPAPVVRPPPRMPVSGLRGGPASPGGSGGSAGKAGPFWRPVKPSAPSGPAIPLNLGEDLDTFAPSASGIHVHTDDQGNIVRTDHDGNIVRTDSEGNVVRTDTVNSAVIKDGDGNIVNVPAAEPVVKPGPGTGSSPGGEWTEVGETTGSDGSPVAGLPTTTAPFIGLEFALPGACNCTGEPAKRCLWVDEPQYLDLDLLEDLEGCICDETRSFCLPCNLTICTVNFERRLEATTETPTTTTQPPTTTTETPETTEKPEFGFKEDAKDQIANQAKAENALQFLAAGLNTSMRQQIGYQREELILQCAFNAQSCDLDKDFEEIQDPNYGNCFAFKAREDSDRSGPVYGLQLILFTDLREYLVTSKMAGARVVVGDPSAYPFPDSTGYNAPTGSAVSFGIRKKRTQRLGDPYGECVNDKTEAKQSYYYEGIYTVEGCFRSCLQESLIYKCGCADPRYPKGGRTEPYCRDETQRECINLAQRTISSDPKFKCSCPLACSETSFDVTISSSFWPLTGVSISGCDEKEVKAEFNDSCAAVYRDMAVMVQVYFEQLNQQLTYETPAFAEDALLADIASQVGFWIGVSVVSIVEFAVLSFKVVLHIFTDFKSKDARSQESWSAKKPRTRLDHSPNKPKPRTGKLRALALSVARFSVADGEADGEEAGKEDLRKDSAARDIELGLSRRRSHLPAHTLSPIPPPPAESEEDHYERLRRERGSRDASQMVADTGAGARPPPRPLVKQDTLPLSLSDV